MLKIADPEIIYISTTPDATKDKKKKLSGKKKIKKMAKDLFVLFTSWNNNDFKEISTNINPSVKLRNSGRTKKDSSFALINYEKTESDK